VPVRHTCLPVAGRLARLAAHRTQNLTLTPTGTLLGSAGVGSGLNPLSDGRHHRTLRWDRVVVAVQPGTQQTRVAAGSLLLPFLKRRRPLARPLLRFGKPFSSQHPGSAFEECRVRLPLIT
jgi:hypothetical protein